MRLAFGPGRQATLRLELLIPEGKGPFPVFMTQHNHRPWALIALRRGYLGCVYAGADSQDDTDTFVEPYAEFDWSRLTRDGVLVMTARRFRTQERNRDDAIARLVEMIRAAAVPPKPRRKTRVSRAAKARRVDEKRRRSATKRLRGSVTRED